MEQKELSELTDQELKNKAKKMKSIAITNALLIGFSIGVIIYSIAVNSVGLFTLIPLFFIYNLVNGFKKMIKPEGTIKRTELKIEDGE